MGASEFSPSSRVRLAKGALLILSVALVAQIFLFSEEARLIVQTAREVSEVRLNDQPPQGARLPGGTREQHLILPGGSMDARWWTLHAERILQGEGLRIRHTNLDNFPEGREVHWSSLLSWTLAGAARLRSLFVSAAPQEHVAEAALHIGPVVGMILLASLAYAVFRFKGAIPALVLANAALGSLALTSTFEAGEADHHGIVVAFAAGSILSLWLGGAGVVGGPESRSPGKRRGKPPLRLPPRSLLFFRISGVFGGAALWVSAATAIPILAACGLGGLLAALVIRGGSSGEGRYHPELWKTWGLWGAISSVAFYLIEYFPFHMRLRLEVNHPLFALSFLAGGHLVARLATTILSGNPARAARAEAGTLGLLAGAAALPLIVAMLFSRSVFWVADPFLHALHKEYIHEFQSLPRLFANEGFTWGFLAAHLWPFVALVATAVILKRGLGGSVLRAALLVALPAALVMQALAIYQIRWSSAAQGIWVVLAAIVSGIAVEQGRSGKAAVWTAAAASVVAVLSVVLIRVPSLLVAHVSERRALEAPIPREHGDGIILRDIAHRLINSSPEKAPVVLTGPNSSTQLAYHGGIKTLGTLYWENMPGIKRAAALLAEPDERRVLEELQAAGITHIVVPSWDNFTEAYMNLLKLEKRMPAEQGEPYLNRVCKGEILPDWLRPFAYPIPSGSGLNKNAVKIFAVLPGQTKFESLFFRGVYHFESFEFDSAREQFQKAAVLRPGHGGVEAYLRKIEMSNPAGGTPPPPAPR